MNRVPKISAMPTIVRAAFLDSGGLKADTPFEMTSTPVSAVQPDEKARSRRKSVMASVAAGAAATTASALAVAPPHINRKNPTPSIKSSEPMNT